MKIIKLMAFLGVFLVCGCEEAKKPANTPPPTPPPVSQEVKVLNTIKNVCDNVLSQKDHKYQSVCSLLKHYLGMRNYSTCTFYKTEDTELGSICELAVLEEYKYRGILIPSAPLFVSVSNSQSAKLRNFGGYELDLATNPDIFLVRFYNGTNINVCESDGSCIMGFNPRVRVGVTVNKSLLFID